MTIYKIICHIFTCYVTKNNYYLDLVKKPSNV